jgi:large subunit ribosomal protein L22
MEAQAKLRYLRMAPRKVRLMADMARGKPASQAVNELRFAHKAAAGPVAKLIKSAVANAVQKSPNVDVDRLMVKEITVDQGPIRWSIMPRAMGRAYYISKKTSHVTVTLTDGADGQPQRKGA